MSSRLVIAVDGGNSKTDLALAREDGQLLALTRGPLSSPYHLGFDGTVKLLGELLDEAIGQAGLEPSERPVAEIASVLMAGVDFPAEEQTLKDAIEQLHWAPRVLVRNDTFAVLRAGTERGWGVAVVCGAGINCVGVAPDGRVARFPSLGPTSGDWGGGLDVGKAAQFAASRSEDLRGPKTSLERLVPAHFGLDTPTAVAEAIHLGKMSERRLLELSPLVFAEASSDPVATSIVQRLVEEVAAMARAALERLELTHDEVEVLLGGGLLQSGDGRLIDAITQELAKVGPGITVRVANSPPIVGAALLGLDELGAGPQAQARLRSELGAAVQQVKENSSVGRATSG